MADDSELDYLKTFLQYVSPESLVKSFSDIKKIASIGSIRRVLIYPGELMNVDGNFYHKRYKIKISTNSESNLMETFNNIVKGIVDYNRGNITDDDYRGVWTFKDDTIGGNPAGFTIVETGGTVNVIASKDSHEMVLELNDTSGVNSVLAYVDIGAPVANNTWEFWFAVSKVTETIAAQILLSENAIGTIKIAIAITEDDLQYHNGTSWVTFATAIISVDTFHHIRIVPNDTTNTFTVYFEQSPTPIGEDLDYLDDSTVGIDQLQFATFTTPQIKFWIDAIGHENSSSYYLDQNYSAFEKNNTLCNMEITHGIIDEEKGKTKRWYQEIYLDVEWSSQ
ncbi:hypothetical protein LCGC14_1587460 [marine sediment metagenome]|uniref:Uncharacterized protein n=1 Tax=marine sediment metagenome TaxID=412755 RepID=A0A0F9KVM9_9ZZZZ